ncbi:ligand-gated channel [Sphingomonas sp. Leaf412]|uniref:TonB-dependent siderophore receptor n=1 Tax=Sphingomonas sp. Leaf412 TaxID=1736370 RepID=UPI0006F75F12|nr:TonB-dependent receptor [Sphingomonas sp. Leaf412]KQT35433.1 ligand-gated channel [Sphingomonas sp. Leaf412]
MLVPALARAEPVAPGEDGDAITVTGVRQPYRGDFALREIPQAIATIDADVIQENAILRLTDALDLNASVTRQSTLGGLWDSFAVRGFAGDENLPSGYLVNGFNAGRGFGGQRDVAGIERIEVLKGPAAAVLGRGEPGGSINLVTKQPRLGRTFGTASLQYRSFDTVRADADANVALSGAVTTRVIAYAEAGGTFRDTVDQKRWGLLPSIGVGLGDATRLTYDFEWTRVEVPFDRGIVVLDGNFDTVPRSRFLGEPGDGDTVARATGHQVRLQHDFDDRWSLLVGASHRDTRLTGASSDAETLRSRQKLYVDGRSLSRQRRTRRYTSEHSVLRAEIAGSFATGALRHRVLIGGDLDHFDTDQVFTRYRGPVVTAATTDRAGYVLDLANPVYGRFPRPVTTALTDRLDVQRMLGGYIQDQIAVGDRLHLRIGARYDDFRLRVDDRLTRVTGQRARGRISPQAGVVYELSDAVSLYAAYGEGYRANIGADAAGTVFEPEVSRSTEAGVKLVAPGGRLTGTLAVFGMAKSNVLATDPLNPGFSVAIGRARSRGVEVDLTGRLPGGVDLLLSYAYTDAEARSRVLDPNFSFAIEPGDPLINVPRHNLNMQAAKRFAIGARRATLGAGVQHVGARSGETGTDFMLPPHTIARLFGEADLTDAVTLYGAVANLFDARWFANSYAPVWVQPGTPRTATIGLRARF